MFKWAQQTLANVAGTAEPIYGPNAIQSVAQQTQETPYTELKKDDERWIVMDSTCVETQVFYVITDDGKIVMAQVIYSNVAGIRTTAQFVSKIFYQDGKTPHLFTSDPLDDYGWDDKKYNFHAKGVAVDLSDDGNSYHIKSSVNMKSIVDVKFSKASPGFMAGKNGTSTFGEDPANPWGRMSHTFWPRCKVEGHILTQAGEVNVSGRGIYIHALQGMKPHHAAARWNFINFQSPTYSAVQMEYTTPPSYGSTVVNVGGIVTDGKIVYAGTSSSIKHTEVKGDPENDWPEPSAVGCKWDGQTADGKTVHAELNGPLGTRADRVDVMAEVPKFVKQIIAGAAGTKPYIYQFSSQQKLKINIGGEEHEEDGTLFSEATFITAA